MKIELLFLSFLSEIFTNKALKSSTFFYRIKRIFRDNISSHLNQKFILYEIVQYNQNKRLPLFTLKIAESIYVLHINQNTL